MLVNKVAPDFSGVAVIGADYFKDICLSDFKGKYVVLSFLPLAFTFVCPTEIKAADALRGQFEAANCELIICSVDSQFTLNQWRNLPEEQGGLNGIRTTLLSDLTHKIAEDYGVLTEAGYALRGSFLIDYQGDEPIVKAVWCHADDVGRNFTEILRVVKNFDFVKHNDVVCPAGFDVDDGIENTIVPDVKDAKKYFESH
ncbi:hypothetical protein PCE1_003567 [Barthelona sp. PCE]